MNGRKARAIRRLSGYNVNHHRTTTFHTVVSKEFMDVDMEKTKPEDFIGLTKKNIGDKLKFKLVRKFTSFSQSEPRALYKATKKIIKERGL